MALCIWTCNEISLERNVYFCATVVKRGMNSQNSDRHWSRTLFFFRLLWNWTCLRCPPGAVEMDGFVWDTDLLFWLAVWNSSSLPYSFCVCWYSEHVRDRQAHDVWSQCGMLVGEPNRCERSALQGPFRQTVIDLIWPICRVKYV